MKLFHKTLSLKVLCVGWVVEHFICVYSNLYNLLLKEFIKLYHKHSNVGISVCGCGKVKNVGRITKAVEATSRVLNHLL